MKHHHHYQTGSRRPETKNKEQGTTTFWNWILMCLMIPVEHLARIASLISVYRKVLPLR